MKRIIRQEDRDNIKKDIINGESIKYVAEKYNYYYTTIEKYIDSKAFCFIEIDGKIHKRCSTCKVVKQLDDFNSFFSNRRQKYVYKSDCKYCENLKTRNRYRMNVNILGEKFLKKSREKGQKSYHKNKVKISFRRKIMRLIKYIDNNGRVNRKFLK